ncbi:ATP-dependent DNA helicase pif1, partial [Araneus ventricosus]
CITFL